MNPSRLRGGEDHLARQMPTRKSSMSPGSCAERLRGEKERASHQFWCLMAGPPVSASGVEAQKERLPLLLKTLTCVTVTMPGPTQEAIFELPVTPEPTVLQLVVTV